MLLIAGLGNPGPQYAGHRHNIGFMALDRIHDAFAFRPWTRKFKGEIAEGQVGPEKVLLLKPLTFMNDSGASVGEAARFYKLEPDRVLVLHDELDLAPGKVRVKAGGGNGGHNGLRSIDAHFGKDYRRVRLGIGHPGSKERVHGHVLSDFGKADRDWLERLLGAVARHAEMLVKGEDALFMNRVHMALESDEPASARGSGSPSADRLKEQGRGRPAAAPDPAAIKPQEGGAMAERLKRLFGRKD